MKKYKSKIKQELMDLIGEISVDELAHNKIIIEIIEGIVRDLQKVSMIEHYRNLQGRRS